jgi:hypothetical protein
MALSFETFPHRPVFYSSVSLTGYLGLEIRPSFAPDGERIALHGMVLNDPELPGLDIKVIAPLPLTNGSEPDISPAWSPDGRLIALLHVIGDGNAEVSLIPAIAPGPRRILARVSGRPLAVHRPVAGREVASCSGLLFEHRRCESLFDFDGDWREAKNDIPLRPTLTISIQRFLPI